MTKDINEFDKRAGQILVAAVGIESALDFFISKYFFPGNPDKEFFFSDTILGILNFEKKVNLFKEICKKEGYDQISLILDAIKFIQETRNHAAHWETRIPHSKIIHLRKRKSETTNKDVLVLDKSLMDKLESKRQEAIKGINGIYLKLSKSGS